MQYVNIKIAGQSVHPIILIRLFIVPYVESIINVIFPDSIYISSWPHDKNEYLKIIFLFLNQNICCGCSKEPSQ